MHKYLLPRTAAEHAHAVRPPSARLRRLMRNPFGGGGRNRTFALLHKAPGALRGMEDRREQ